LFIAPSGNGCLRTANNSFNMQSTPKTFVPSLRPEFFAKNAPRGSTELAEVKRGR
jgi:hypothetical protein